MTYFELLNQWGLPLGFLIIALITGARGDWVFKREVQDLRDQNKRLQERLDRAEKIAERGTVTADRATRLVERRVEADDP